MRKAAHGPRARSCDCSRGNAMNAFRKTLPLVALGLMAAPASAQEYLGYPSYREWKAATYGVTLVPHVPTVVTAHPELRGGAETCDCWHEPDGSYTTINNNSDWTAGGFNNTDDGSFGPLALPFQFYLYGQLWNSVFININGNVTFGSTYDFNMGTFSSTGFPVNGYPIVAPFWADVDLGGSCGGCNQVQYKVTPTALYVNWTNVGYFSTQTDLLNTFQVIITDGTDPVVPNGANVSFCYKDMQWTTGGASGGTGGFGGTPASVGANQGNGVDYIQFGRFDHAGTDYDGPFGAADGVSFLDDQYFSYSTDITLANVPPVISGQSVCDTLVLCVNESSILQVAFLSPEPDQTTVPDVSSPTLTGISILTATTGVNASITVEVTPTLADVGYHTITFTGADNGTPAITSTLNVVLLVQTAADMEPGSANVCDNGDPVDLYALIGGTPAPGGDWTDPNGNAHTGTFLPGEDPDGVYLYEIGAGGNCPNSAEVTMTTTAHVEAGGEVDDAAYCSDHAPVDLFVLLANADDGGFWLSPEGQPFSGTLQPGSDVDGDYLYVVLGAGPCPNDTGTVQIRLEDAADAGDDASITLCADADPLILLDALNGDPDPGGTWADPGTATFGDTFNAGTDAAGPYTYTVDAVLPCPQQSSTLDITVDPLPQAGEDDSLAVCADGAVVELFSLLGGIPDNGGSWLDPLGHAHNGSLDPAADTSGTYTYVVLGPNTCVHLSDTATIIATVNPLPVISFLVEPDSGCDPLTVKFTNTTDPAFLGDDCSWNLGDGSSGLTACDTLVHQYAEPGWYNATLEITTPEGCTDHYTLQGAVLVDPTPVADFTWTPDIGTLENSTLLFTAEDPHATTFAWDFGGTDSSGQRQVAHSFPHIFSGEYQVCLNVEDRYGCADSLCQTVTVTIPLLYAPNAFTPDGNGFNEVFLPVVSGVVAEDHELMIFDRWGQQVFDSTDLTEGWNGALNNSGEILPEGVYNWRLVERPTGSSDKKDWFGTVTLLK